MKSRTKDLIILIFVPIILAIITFFLVNNICLEKFNVEDIIDDYKTMLGIWGTLLGFLITAESILIALGDSRFIDILKQAGYFKTILLTFMYASIHLMIAIVVSIIVIFWKIDFKGVFAFLCSLTVDTMIMVLFCVYFLFVLVLRAND